MVAVQQGGMKWRMKGQPTWKLRKPSLTQMQGGQQEWEISAEPNDKNQDTDRYYQSTQTLDQKKACWNRDFMHELAYSWPIHLLRSSSLHIFSPVLHPEPTYIQWGYLSHWILLLYNCTLKCSIVSFKTLKHTFLFVLQDLKYVLVVVKEKCIKWKTDRPFSNFFSNMNVSGPSWNPVWGLPSSRITTLDIQSA